MSKENRKNSGERSQRIQTIAGAVLCIILVPILILNLTLIIKSFIHPDEVPGIGGKIPLIVMSDSMYPMFQTGDLLICKSVDPSDLKKDDVVAYYFETEDAENGEGFTVVAHRIVDIDKKDGKLMFTMRGDANNIEDPDKVSEDDILGIYSTHIKGLGRVAMFMQTTQGLIVCVVLPIILLVGIDILRRRRYDRYVEGDTAELMAELEELRALKDNSKNADASQSFDPDMYMDNKMKASASEEKMSETDEIAILQKRLKELEEQQKNRS